MITTPTTTPEQLAQRHLTVRVLLNARGQWEVLRPHCARPLRCTSLDDATREAYAVAARNAPCDLVVHDAYHRIVRSDHVGAQ
jgi:hypothetical protein